jgi:hypothetical protein
MMMVYPFKYHQNHSPEFEDRFRRPNLESLCQNWVHFLIEIKECRLFQTYFGKLLIQNKNYAETYLSYRMQR